MASRINRAKIKELRNALDYTQLEAAKRAGIKTAAQWSDIENGHKGKENISIETLYAVAGALGVMPCDLLLPPETPKRAKRPKAKK